jgi:transposase
VTTSGTRGSEGLADGVVLGVDTHLDFHVAVVWPGPWRDQGSNDREGLRETRPLAEGFGLLRCAGVEGTGSYGAGLARLHLRHRRYARLRDSRSGRDLFRSGC